MGVDRTQEQDNDEEGLIRFRELAPRFTSVFEQVKVDPQARTDEVEVYRDKVGGQIVRVAEREVILDFERYLKELKDLLRGRPASLGRLEDIKASFGYIGVEEYTKATKDMAAMIFTDWAKDERVAIYCPGSRSEALIALMVLEELRNKGLYPDFYHSDPSENKKRRGHIVRLLENTRFLPFSIDGGEHPKIWALDDFMCSGTRVRTSGGRLFDKLLQRGVDPNIAANTIKIAVVAAPENKAVEVFGDEIGRRDESWRLATYSFFKTHNVAGNFSRTAFTGIYCPLDYTFTELLLPLEQEAGVANGAFENNRTKTPMLMRVVRPYESKTSGYIERWRSVE